MNEKQVGKVGSTYLKLHGLCKAHITVGTFVLLISLTTAESVTSQAVEGVKLFMTLHTSMLFPPTSQGNTRDCLTLIW